MEDVRADDLVCAEREDDEQRQPEEDAAPDGRQADDEAAEDADEDRGDLVALLESASRGIAGRPAVCTRLFAISPTAPNSSAAPSTCPMTDFASSP